MNVAHPPIDALPVSGPVADCAYGLREARIFLPGHQGMVGTAIHRRLCAVGVPEKQILTCSRASLDLTNQGATRAMLEDLRPDVVVLAAAKVGGILANSSAPADFLYENMMIEANVIHGAHVAGVNRLLFLGSSCIYPRNAPQPIVEKALLTGPLESTNAAYAVAKIAGLTLCEGYATQYGRDYRAVMPTNLYGPNDNFDPMTSHVLPALLRRFHEASVSGAPSVTIWGSGRPRREFLHVDDMADAALTVLGLPKSQFDASTSAGARFFNVGTGRDIAIADLAARVADITGFRGEILYDLSRPDGTTRKRLDVGRLSALGWTARISLKDGLRETYAWFREHAASMRA